MQSVYVFADPRYERGIKIGMGRLLSCLHDSQGYAPEGLICLRAWHFPSRKDMAAGEKAAIAALKHDGFDRLIPERQRPPRNGEEWIAAAPEEGLPVIERLFRSPGSQGPVVTSFRQDKVLSTPERQGRLVLWVFRELLTGRLKISTCSEFASPRAQARRYSRNGYEEVAAYVVPPPVSLETNSRLFEIRLDLLKRHGHGERSLKFGWLREGIFLQDIFSELDEIPELIRLADFTKRPLGVRPSYTGQSQVPPSEFSVFSHVWWLKKSHGV